MGKIGGDDEKAIKHQIFIEQGPQEETVDIHGHLVQPDDDHDDDEYQRLDERYEEEFGKYADLERDVGHMLWDIRDNVPKESRKANENAVQALVGSIRDLASTNTEENLLQTARRLSMPAGDPNLAQDNRGQMSLLAQTFSLAYAVKTGNRAVGPDGRMI